jgi:hypothetical protein
MEQEFNSILQKMQSEDSEVSAGNMMRSPAISFRSKVFAFYYQEQMVFKLDAKAPSTRLEFPGSEFLNPFKNKPPMKGWLVIPARHHHQWSQLAQEAYENIKSMLSP